MWSGVRPIRHFKNKESVGQRSVLIGQWFSKT